MSLVRRTELHATPDAPEPVGTGFVPTPAPVRPQPFWMRHRTYLILAVIFICAAFFRFYGRDFDQGTSQHPDEIAIVSHTLGVNWPTSFQQFLDPKSSPLNLRLTEEYPWGSLPVYLSRAAAWVVDNTFLRGDKSPDYYVRDFHGATLVGRWMASIFDLITVLLVFLITRRLYSSLTALIATALVAFAVTEIQIAHFYISEPFLVCFMVGAVYFSVVLMQKPSWWAAASAGACIGLAVASKVTIAPFGLIVLAAVLLRAGYRKKSRKLGADLGDPVGVMPATAKERERSFWGHALPGLRYVLIAAVFSVLAFAITEPYALWQFDWSRLQVGPGQNFGDGVRAVLDSNPWSRRILAEAATQSGQADVPFTRQYIGTIPVLYPLEQMVIWGIGVIPGLVALAGFFLALWLALRRRAPAEIILLAGAIPYFYTIANLESKWMRYMLPLVPIFCILGAALLVRGALWGQTRFRKRASERGFGMRALQRNFFPIAAALSVGFAFLWAVAFMNIYSQDHTRVQAAKWVNNNVPTGATLSHEGWDAGLPSLEAGYKDVEFDLYDDRGLDDELTYIKGQLEKTDYIILASNRLYGSIPREPWRYPVQIEFYKLLFADKLGYVRVHTTQVTPSLFGVTVNDQLADESFTVYDHPRVDIFKKVSALTDDQLHILFATALDRPAGQYSAQRHGKVEDDKSLMLDQPLQAQLDTGDYAWNPLAQDDTQWIGVLLWLIATYVIGFAAMPLAFKVFRRLPDKGYAFAKLLGLLLVSWGVCMLASLHLVPFTVWSILFVLLMLAAFSLLLWRLGAGADIRDFFANKRRLILFYEGLFLLAFAAFLIIRMLNPDLWQPTQGGEKPMEFGFLNAILRSPWMPPADPFFAGGYINYYYQGQFIIACLIKLIGVDPAIGINIAIPLLYGLTFTAGASIVYNIVAWSRRRRGSTHAVSRVGMAFAVLGGVLMVVIGNMYAVVQWITVTFPKTLPMFASWVQSNNISTDFKPTFDFWTSSRIIPGTINEFPFWSFLFADFHPHLIDMPFTLLAAALALNLAFAGRFRMRNVEEGFHKETRRRGVLLGGIRNTQYAIRNTLRWLWGDGWAGALNFGVTAIALGTLFAVNTWDFPTYLGLVGGAALIALLLSRKTPAGEVEADAHGAPASAALQDDKPLRPIGTLVLVATSIVSIGLLAGVAILTYLPFLLNFKAFFTKILPLVDGGMIDNTGAIMHRTTLPEYLTVWAIFIFITASYLLVRLWQFPWRAAFASLANLLPSGTKASQPRPSFSPTHAFQTAPPAQTEASLPMRRAGRLNLAPAFSGGISQGSTTLAFAAPKTDGSITASSPVAEPLQPTSTTPDVGETQDVANGHPEEVDQIVEPYAIATGSAAIENGTDHASEAVPLHDNGVYGETPEAAVEAESLVHGNGASNSVSNGAQSSEPIFVLLVSNWVADAHSAEAQRQIVVMPVQINEQPGVIPLWAGFGLLALTAALTVSQIATGQLLLALLVALAGGLIATLLSTTRSASALFGGMLLIGALLVSLGVEVVYLADHNQGGSYYRMNTVFKFYEQIWVLFALGGAVAIYYIIYGLRGRLATHRARLPEAPTPDNSPGNTNEALAAIPLTASAITPNAEHTNGAEIATGAPNKAPRKQHTAPSTNWLVWSADDMEATGDGLEASTADADTRPLQVIEQPELTLAEPPQASDVTPDGNQSAKDSFDRSASQGARPETGTVSLPTPESAQQGDLRSIKWTWPRIAWTALFTLLLLMSLIFPIYGTQSRVENRFDVHPPVGTLDGMAYMTKGVYNANLNVNNTPVAVTVNLKYDYDAIKWLNANVSGLKVMAELPTEYYRNDGMRVAANTGLPMVVGGLHQEEQRADVYARLVGNRQSDMNDFFSTADVQKALIIMSKYDIDYIYLGQLEQAQAGDAGMKKFAQLAGPKVGILTQVYNSNAPAGLVGTIIYQVVKQNNKDPKLVAGAPVANSGIPGISITPLPTSTPVPPPTPPVDDPTLKALIADVAANPTDRDKRGKLVEWYRDHGYQLEAAQELEILVKQDPSNIGLRHQLGDAYQAAGQPDKALKAWEDARDVAPDNPDAHNKVGIAYFERKRYDDAQREFQAAVDVQPGYIESWFHLGEVYERKGDLDNARKAYQAAIANSKEPNGWKDSAQQRLDQIK